MATESMGADSERPGQAQRQRTASQGRLSLEEIDAILDDPRWARYGDGAEPSGGLPLGQPAGRYPVDDVPWSWDAVAKKARSDGPGQPGQDRANERGPSIGAYSAPLQRRRGRPARCANDPEGDLPACAVPSGYVRDSRGRWRYSTNGLAVPGACDITLANLYSFACDADVVLVPTELSTTTDELAWCARVAVGERVVELDGKTVLALEVPVDEWERRCHVPLGLAAPELAATMLLSLSEAARLAGVSPRTVAAYVSRRRRAEQDATLAGRPVPPEVLASFPPPVVVVGAHPLWSAPVVRSWLSTRPPHGGRRPRADEGARSKTGRSSRTARRVGGARSGGGR